MVRCSGILYQPPAYHNQLKPAVNKSYSQQRFFKIRMIMPQEWKKKISSVLDNLDNLITLHQRKYFIMYNKLITWEQRKLKMLLSLLRMVIWRKLMGIETIDIRLQEWKAYLQVYKFRLSSSDEINPKL